MSARRGTLDRRLVRTVAGRGAAGVGSGVVASAVAARCSVGVWVETGFTAAANASIVGNRSDGSLERVR
jgi:hypothetical protein